MKRYAAALLCILALCSLAMTARAAEEDTAYWKEAYGVPEPRYDEYDSDFAYRNAYDAWFQGFSDFVLQQTRPAEVSAPADPEPIKQESAGEKHGSGSTPLESDADSKYPVGSYVDPSGIVWAPDGTRLTPSSVLDAAQASGLSEDGPLLSSELGPSDSAAASADLDTLELIAGLVSDIATDPPVFTVEDLRPANPPVEVLTGLKVLVTSVFGEYTPVTTTSVVTQTVGNDTQQYLVETVAPGAAGVDYEWLAGVFLFGILLFCLLKLLGGVLK